MASTLISDGIWTWFNHPVAQVANGKLFVGSMSKNMQRPCITAYDLVNQDEIVSAFADDASIGENDDHNNPAVLVLANGELLTAWSGHSNVSIGSASATSTNAGDVRFWDTKVTGSTANSAYAQLLQAGDTNSTIYWFYRNHDASERPQYFRTSTNNGASWSSSTKFFANGSNRPYFRWWKTSGSRFDFACTEAQPTEGTTDIYHGYMTIASDGTRAYYKSDGTSIGDDTALPLDQTDLTLVYDGTTNRAWIWDLKSYSGTPYVVFAVFVGGTSTHEYHRGYWNGSSWTTEKICDAGTSGTADYLYAAEAYYSGGVCLDPNNTEIVYVSREYGSGDFRVETWTKSGGTWSKTADLSGNTSSVNARPVAVDNSGSTIVLWWSGTYTSYTSYNTSVVTNLSPSFRTAKPASPVEHEIWTPASARLILPLQETTNIAPVDMLGNYTMSLTGTVTRTSDTLGYYCSGFSTSNYFTGNTLASDIDGEAIRWMAVMFSNTSTSDQFLIGFGRSSSNNPIAGLNINAGASGTIRYYNRNDSNTANNVDAASTSCNDGNIHTIMGVTYSGNRHRLYYDGVQQTNFSNTSTGTQTFDRFAVGCLLRATASLAFSGKIYAVAVGYGGIIPTPSELHQDWINGRFSGFEAAESTGKSPPPFQRRMHFWRPR